MKNVLLGLDIGTSKVCAALVEMDSDGEYRLLGTGLAESKGINKGFVSNLDKLIDSIGKAAHAAEEKGSLKAHRVITNISGASVSGAPQEGMLFLARRGREIKARDVQKAIDTTKHISYTMEKDLLYAAPQEFTIDETHEVEDPVGLFGTKLKVKLYVITALTSHVQNISKAVNYAGYELIDIVPTAVAAAHGILRDEERTGGAIIIDIGGGVTELLVFRHNTFRFFDSVNVGGMDLTSSLSSRFKIPFGRAEMIKMHHAGIAREDLENDQENIFDIEDKHIVIKSGAMNGALKERFDEIFHVLRERLEPSGYSNLSIPSVVVTGGCALLHGALESVEKGFNIRTRLGGVTGVIGDPAILNNPVYASAVSIAKFGLDKHKRKRSYRFKDKFFIVDTFHKFREFLDDYF